MAKEFLEMDSAVSNILVAWIDQFAAHLMNGTVHKVLETMEQWEPPPIPHFTQPPPTLEVFFVDMGTRPLKSQQTNATNQNIGAGSTSVKVI